MRSRWLLRPISIGVVILVLGVSVIGCIALRRVVNEDRNRILTERGAAAKVVIDSLFQQEFSTLTVLGQVANTHRADATRDFEAAAATSMTVGVKAIGFASLHNQRLVVRGLVGDQIAHRDKAATGTLAALLSRASHSFSGVTGIMHNSRGTQVVFAIPVNELVIFAELPVTPKKPIPSATPPFDTLRGSLYASPTATPATLVLTTEKHLPLSGGPV